MFAVRLEHVDILERQQRRLGRRVIVIRRGRRWQGKLDEVGAKQAEGRDGVLLRSPHFDEGACSRRLPHERAEVAQQEPDSTAGKHKLFTLVELLVLMRCIRSSIRSTLRHSVIGFSNSMPRIVISQEINIFAVSTKVFRMGFTVFSTVGVDSHGHR